MGDTTKKFVPVSETVFSNGRPILTISRPQLEFLKGKLPISSRLLLHKDSKEALHEMLIMHSSGTYIRPHINDGTDKSFLIIDGEMIVVVFQNDGSILHKHRLSAVDKETSFMIRLNEPLFHTLYILSKNVLFLETVLGPHYETRYADFAPHPDETISAQEYLEWLEEEVKR